MRAFWWLSLVVVMWWRLFGDWDWWWWCVMSAERTVCLSLPRWQCTAHCTALYRPLYCCTASLAQYQLMRRPRQDCGDCLQCDTYITDILPTQPRLWSLALPVREVLSIPSWPLPWLQWWRWWLVALLHIDWVGVEVEVVSEISGQCWQPGRAEHSEQSPVKSGHNRHSQE